MEPTNQPPVGENEPVTPGAPAAEAAGSKMPLVVYILYLSSIVLGITSIIGVIMAYVSKGDAPDWEQTHYRFQIRTFWIGLLFGAILMVMFMTMILAPIAMILSLLVLIWFVVRCVKGLIAFNDNKPIANPKTWMF